MVWEICGLYTNNKQVLHHRHFDIEETVAAMDPTITDAIMRQFIGRLDQNTAYLRTSGLAELQDRAAGRYVIKQEATEENPMQIT